MAVLGREHADYVRQASEALAAFVKEVAALQHREAQATIIRNSQLLGRFVTTR